MWTREMIKTRAKDVLRFNYWKAFVVSFILLLVGGRNNGGGGSGGGRNGRSYYSEELNGEMLSILLMALGIIVVVLLIIALLRITLGYMLEVGGKKFFVRAAEGETNMGYLGFGFSEGRYLSILAAMFLRGLYTFLWTLLLIIPGIIKAYAYRMVPYILADNPNIGATRAIELSKEMTQGEKWDIFVLDLSFIGWYFLGALAFGVGTLFVMPYDDATNAELYIILRKQAIERGVTTYSELNLLSPVVEE